ncbi:hypothetical protein SAMN05421806_11559 [Streptomyces indicus]|uniref:Secreted protein n=1 Tax=Streptomyces indicus TaxID=417292 RepID=A0A1G9G967_9ACTN|nr:hypothetical protein [Streptomyces indicus]SDK97172.1 hypothetical protein SAMN05421806_11559 [Streptomyces indicus]
MAAGAIRKARAVLVLLALALVLTLAGPFSGDAHAASRCTGRKVADLRFSTGNVQVYRSGGYLCAMTYAKHRGPLRPMAVSIQARGSRPVVKSGLHRASVGPVRTHVGHRKVWIKGAVGRGKVSKAWSAFGG